MNALRKPWAILLASVLLIGAAISVWMFLDAPPQPTATLPMEPPKAPTPSGLAVARADADDLAERPDGPSARALEERHKAKDREHLRQLHHGLFEYKKLHGHFPEYLSQLVPDFVSADALQSPRNEEKGMNYQLSNHPDPGNERPGYGYEFSNLVFRDDRTFSEIKETQRAEWGDAVPILRAFGYGKVINMSYGGALYETDLNWEWDPATLDVVRAHGWGPGLTGGQFTEVRVLGADGQPVANAQVWADGRMFSFSLPNRPFATDASGVARIPLGADVNRTELVLRVDSGGLASPAVAFPRGEPPQSYDLTAEPAQTVGGRVTDVNGSPIADTWIYLKKPGASETTFTARGGANLGAVKTDASGQWTASLHPKDASAFNIAIGSEGNIPQFNAGDPVDAAAAAARNAVSILHTPPGRGTAEK